VKLTPRRRHRAGDAAQAVERWKRNVKTRTFSGHFVASSPSSTNRRLGRPLFFLREPQTRSGTPRVSIVQGFTPVPRGRVGHPPRCPIRGWWRWSSGPCRRTRKFASAVLGARWLSHRAGHKAEVSVKPSEAGQNPNLFCTNGRKDSAPPRVSVVQGFTPVPLGRVRHPPPGEVISWLQAAERKTPRQ
jgi:hypothetical protein